MGTDPPGSGCHGCPGCRRSDRAQEDLTLLAGRLPWLTWLPENFSEIAPVQHTPQVKHPEKHTGILHPMSRGADTPETDTKNYPRKKTGKGMPKIGKKRYVHYLASRVRNAIFPDFCLLGDPKPRRSRCA